MKRLLFAITLILICLYSFAQEKKQDSILNKNDKDILSESKKSDNNNLKLNQGYQGIIESGYIFLSGNGGHGLIILNFINGYRFNPYFSLGLGVGVILSPWELFSGGIIPIFLNLRSNFLNKKVSPYASFDIGRCINIDYLDKGVFILNPTLGVRVKIKEKIAFFTGFGYELFVSRTAGGGGFCLNMGISF